MPDTPASPRASRLATPSWLDTRLVLGVLLVLVSVVVGARVLSSADRSTLVWAAATDLAAGTTVDAGRLEQVRVRFFDEVEDRYVPASQDPSGLVLSRALGPGDLLPRGALLAPQSDVDFRLVTVAVEGGHLPSDLDPSQQVDVWVTPKRTEPADAPAGAQLQLIAAQLVLQGVTVSAVARDRGGFGGASTSVPVELQVRPNEVARLVSAMALGTIDLVRVPREAESAGRLEPAAEAG